MYRRELPEGRGMLFDFKEDRPVGMWMKNTYISLDMLFIRSDGTIVKIAEKTKPHSLKNIMSGPPVRGVLEVIGGTARKFGIRPGDKVVHPIFRPLIRRFVVFLPRLAYWLTLPSTRPPASFR